MKLKLTEFMLQPFILLFLFLQFLLYFKQQTNFIFYLALHLCHFNNKLFFNLQISQLLLISFSQQPHPQSFSNIKADSLYLKGSSNRFPTLVIWWYDLFIQSLTSEYLFVLINAYLLSRVVGIFGVRLANHRVDADLRVGVHSSEVCYIILTSYQMIK